MESPRTIVEGRPHPTAAARQSMAALVAAATFPWNPEASLVSYLRSAQVLLKSAREQDGSGVNDQAFIHYLRYTRLVLEYLPQHREYKSPSMQGGIREAKKECNDALERLEALKAEIVAADAAARAAQTALAAQAKTQVATPPQAPPQALGAVSEHGGVLAEPYMYPTHGRSSSGNLQHPTPYPNPIKAYTMPEAPPGPALSSGFDATSVYHVPNIYHSRTPSQLGPMHGLDPTHPPLHGHHSHSAPPPSRPEEPIRAVTEEGRPLRSVYVPDSLMGEFLRFAGPNTDRKIETCAILGARKIDGAYRISHLVIPRQTGTGDSCSMEGEEMLFGALEERGLMCVGWIHTHPTQSAFLSSVDLHTHAPYQHTLPEAIAIVCAPRSTPTWGIYRLTDPPGIGVIRQCHGRGFHHHPHEQQLYTDIGQGGHVFFIKYQVSVIDLR